MKKVSRAVLRTDQLRLVWLRPKADEFEVRPILRQLEACLSEAQLDVINTDTLALLWDYPATSAADIAENLVVLTAPYDRDWSLSWTWVAACLGDHQSMVVLSNALLSEKIADEPRITPDACRKLAISWQRALVAAKAERERKVEQLTAEDVARFLDEPEPVVPGAVILDAIGDPDHKGMDMKRYASLTEPMPLLGGVADLMAVERSLLATYPWMTATIKHVVRGLRLARAEGRAGAYFSPLLLVGKPGCGKSDFLPTLAAALGVRSRVLSFAGMANSMTIEGTARGYVTATPGLVPAVCHQFGTANPLIAFDEIEKACASSVNGSPIDAVLPLLEGSTGKSLFDPCLLGAVDATHVMFAATANSTRLPAPLLDRFDIVEVPCPNGDHLEAILGTMRLRQAAKQRVRVEELPPLAEGDVEWLRGILQKSGSIRQLAKAYGILRAEALDMPIAAVGPVH